MEKSTTTPESPNHPAGTVMKYVGVGRKEQHLEDGVSATSPCAVFAVAPGQVVPDDDHGDAPGQADEVQAHHVLVVAGQKGPRPERT